MSQNENLSKTSLIRDLVKYILNNSVPKFPIKRSDVITHVFSKNKTLYKEIFEVATSKLEEVYGIKVVDVPETRNFICISTMTGQSRLEFPKRNRVEVTLLFLILSCIFMEGGTMKEDMLFRFLKTFGVEMDKPHEYFGDVKTLVRETFPKQLYLTRVRDTHIETEDMYDLSWGFRSTVEFSKQDMLKQVAEILDRRPEEFVSQYDEAFGENAGGENDDGVVIVS